MEQQQKCNTLAGDIQFELMEINRLRRDAEKDSIGLESYTLNSGSGGILTIICC